MVNKPKNKGTRAETLVVDHLVGSGVYPDAHRSALSGINDIGDIVGTGDITFQVKNVATPQIPAWLRATEEQRVRGLRTYGVLVVKRSGIGARNVGLWAAVMGNEAWKTLWREASKPNLNFLAPTKSPSKALAWSMLDTEVLRLDFSKGVDVNGETSCRMMSLDGVLNLLEKRLTNYETAREPLAAINGLLRDNDLNASGLL